MVGTRRKSKAAAAAATENEHDGVSDEHFSNVTFNIAIPADVDIASLQDILPDISLGSPTQEDIVSLYKSLLATASEAAVTQRDLDEARAEIERKDVELDQALQDRESQAKDFESAQESVHNELGQVKRERDQLASSNAALQAQISTLSNSQSSSSTEVDSLKHRLEDAEREKRDLMGVINRLKEDSAQREEEVQTLRSNLKQARQDHQTLEGQIRELRSSGTSNQFKIDTLTQQLQLSQTETERATNELNSKVEEFAKYRRTKHAELSQLQVSYDSLSQTHTAIESSYKTLQSAHTSQSHQLTQNLIRVQDLTGKIAEQETSFVSEASGLKRLVSVMEEREQQAKSIVENIEKEWAIVGEKTEKREAALRAEVEKEKRLREEVERRAEQLETVLDRMGRGELPIPGRGTPVPGTPGTPARTSGNFAPMSDGMLGLSPTVAMVSKVQRGGKTFTDVYADYVRLQEEFTKKSAEYDHMDRTLSAVLAQIEERAPILSQQRAEYERLQSEATQLASQLSQALNERDGQSNLARDASQQLKMSFQENKLLQGQLDDLGRQVQTLLKELGRQQDPSIPSDEILDQMELPAESIDDVITNNLVLFRSIGGLQEQNQKLLKIVRELGTKMESEEKAYRDGLDLEQIEAVREAHETIQDLAAKLEMQKKSSEVTIQAYMKERDTLKSMLSRAERGAGSASTGGASNPISAVPGDSSSELAKELVEMQTQFESYKTEMGTDSVKLREELVNSQREVGQLNTTLAKANAKVEYLNDRQRMSQEQLTMQGRELDNLTKRNQQLYDQFMRVDIECNRASEDLLSANGRVEQLRNECANLRAEKKIWESVQSRLVDENKNLAVERAHLSDLMSNVQKMHNDLERSGANDRRRLESQMQMMESQTQDLRTQLSRERDNVRHISLQKDIELKELHSRLDKNVEELSKARESLVGAETSRNHLKERVDELARQLQGNEEKLAVYERRTSNVNGASHAPDQSMSREQQLEQEVADLRSTLKVMEVDLAAARSHMQQFQEISQANEAALTALNATHDEYKGTMEAQLARNELEYTTLQGKLHDMEQDVAQAREQINDLQRNLESERSAWANDKKTLEDTIIDISTSEKHSETDRTSRENELRQLEERAIASEDRYSREVLAHAESIKTLDTLKQHLSTIQASARDSRAAAATSEAKLAASEGSWKLQKEALDKEVVDLNARCKDLAAQNTLLHQHLESVSSQAARIRQVADTSAVPQDEQEVVDADTKLSELRSVVAYLRKEKEIVDLQLELSKQENVRLKAQIDHLSQSLDETRATLAEERERAVEAASSDTQHAELLERINQLNILRESNATLRADCETYSKKARELDTKLRELSSQLEPAKEHARLAQAELEARCAQVTRLEDESRRWQERNTQLLSKYDRIDPADVQSLKDEIENLRTQKDAVQQALAEREKEFASQAEKLEKSDDTLRKHKEAFTRASTNLKDRIGAVNNEKSQLNVTIAELRTQVTTLTTERDTLQGAAAPAAGSGDNDSQTETLRKDKGALEKVLASLNGEKSHLNTTIVELQTQVKTLTAERDALRSTTVPAPGSDNTNLIETLRKDKGALVKTLASLNSEKSQLNATVAELRAQVKTLTAERETLQGAASGSGDTLDNVLANQKAQIETLRNEKSELEKALADEKAVKSQPPAQQNPIDEKAIIAAAIVAHDRQLQAKRAEEIAAAVESGRLEQSAKGKIKDAQLVRAQAKLKDLEAQILEWRKSGILPTPANPTTAPGAGSTKNPSANTASPATAPAAPSTSDLSANTSTAPAVASTSDPSAKTVATPSSAPPAHAARGRGGIGSAAPPGRGRGAATAARGARGRGAALSIRGAAPGGAPQSPNTTSAAGGGVSIMGAANKRGREEGEGESDNLLLKRIKPAPEAPGPSKPVAIRRPPPDS